MNVAVFASGGGSNFKALIEAQKRGDLPITIALLLCNNSSANAIKHAKEAGIESHHIAPSHFDSEEEYCSELLKLLDSKNIEIIVLAGYMKKIPKGLIQKFPQKIVNIHPSLLPSFGGKGMFGLNIHKAVIDSGSQVTGITIHFVNEDYDKGAIIFQKTVPVYFHDNPEMLAKRVLRCEHDSLWRVIKAVALNDYQKKDRRIYVPSLHQ